MPSLDEIRVSIETRIKELRSEMSSLQAARAALHDSGAPGDRSARVSHGNASPRQPRTPATRASRPSAARPQGRSRRPSSTERKPSVPVAGRLESLLGQSDGGLSASAIAEQVGARDAQVRQLLQELSAGGRVRRTGIGRGTRWLLVTDDDRVAQRAAELAKLARSK
jgi:FaeA-like protein